MGCPTTWQGETDKFFVIQSLDQFRTGLKGTSIIKYYSLQIFLLYNPLSFTSASLSTAASDRWLESWGAMGDDGDDDYDDGFGDENTQESLGRLGPSPSWPSHKDFHRGTESWGKLRTLCQTAIDCSNICF